MRHGPLNFASSLWMMSSSVSVTLTSVYVQTVQMLAVAVSCQRTAGLWLVRVLSSRLCSAPLCLVASDVSRCSWNEADSVLRGGSGLFRVVYSSLISDRSVSLSLSTFPLSLYLHEVDSYSCSDMLDACRRVLASVRTTYDLICWRARQTFAWRSV